MGSDVWFPEDGEDVLVFNAEGDVHILSLVQAIDASPKARLKRSGDFVMESPRRPTSQQAQNMQFVSDVIRFVQSIKPSSP